MKIFYKKDYLELLDKEEELQNENKDLKNQISNKEFEYLDKYNKASKDYEKLSKKHEELELEVIKMKDQINVLTVKFKKSADKNRVGTRKIHELEKDVDYWKKQFEESMTDKYLIHKVPQGRKPKGQRMKSKSNAVQSKIITKVKNND